MEVIFDESDDSFALLVNRNMGKLLRVRGYRMGGDEAEDRSGYESIIVKPYSLYLFQDNQIVVNMNSKGAKVAYAVIPSVGDEQWWREAEGTTYDVYTSRGWSVLRHRTVVPVSPNIRFSKLNQNASNWTVYPVHSAKMAVALAVLDYCGHSQLLPHQILNPEWDEFDEESLRGERSWCIPIHDQCGRKPPIYAVCRTFLSGLSTVKDIQVTKHIPKGGGLVMASILKQKQFPAPSLILPQGRSTMRHFRVSQTFNSARLSLETQVVRDHGYQDIEGKVFSYLSRDWTVIRAAGSVSDRQGELFLVKSNDGVWAGATQALVDRMLYGAKLTDEVVWHPVRCTYGDLMGQTRLTWCDLIEASALSQYRTLASDELAMHYHDGKDMVAVYVKLSGINGSKGWHLDRKVERSAWDLEQEDKVMLAMLLDQSARQSKKEQQELVEQLDWLLDLD